jgi:arylsulfatase A-like enzyme
VETLKNVILLTIDACRRDVFGSYGSTSGLTPFLDSIQDRCIRFTRAQSTGPYTQAAFPGILTSGYYLDYGQPKGLAPERTLISEPLTKRGVTAAAFHSNPYCSGYFGWDRGWSVFYDSMEEELEEGIPYVRGPVLNERVTAWLRSHVAKDDYNPFFLWLHYMDIHEPYVPERQFIDIVNPSLTTTRQEMEDLFENVLLKRDTSDAQAIALMKQLYDVHVREEDGYVEVFFDTLESLNVLQDSVVIITVDHGDEFDDHGGLSHDDKMYRELIDIPLFIYDPQLQAGQICDTLVSTIDIPPTVLHLLGLDPVPSFQGRSLLPLDEYPVKGCFGEAIDQRAKKGGDIEKDVYFYREDDLKIIHRADKDTWELYDLAQDPQEMNNIVDSSDKTEDMKIKLSPKIRRWPERPSDG